MTTCAQFGEEAADLALGHVSEPRRGELLAHAGGCSPCGGLLADLSSVGDRLLELVPEVDPPVGFEARAVAGMIPVVPSPRPRRTLALAVAAAAAAVVLLLAGVAIGRRSAGGDLARGTIVNRSGERLGTVELDRSADRLILTMDGASDWDGTWTCELADDGRWVAVGTWTADEVTNHVWAAGVDPALGDATAMRITAGGTTVIATAMLQPTR